MMMRFRKYKFLGEGSYGSVHLAGSVDNSFSTSNISAVKSAYLSSSVASLQREKLILDQFVGCPYIIQCFGHDRSIENGEIMYNMMMEYAPGGTLQGFMKAKDGGMIQESEAACYTAMLLQGLCFAHDKGIVHCDMNPDNILVFPMEMRDGVLNNVVKIADFGLAKKVSEKEVDGRGRTSLNRGALLYASPEAVMFGVHEPAADVWALGCIVAEMLTGHPVWGNPTREELIELVTYVKPIIPESVSEIGRDFLQRCFYRDHGKRWTTRMLLRHPFIANNLCHFRGIEHMIFQRNPFASTSPPFGICRTNTFSDNLAEQTHCQRQPCLFYPTIHEMRNDIEEHRSRLSNLSCMIVERLKQRAGYSIYQ